MVGNVCKWVRQSTASRYEMKTSGNVALLATELEQEWHAQQSGTRHMKVRNCSGQANNQGPNTGEP